MPEHPHQSFYDDLWSREGAALSRHERDRFAVVLGLVAGLPRPNNLVLDAGCGTGKLAARLRAHGEVTAVDWSEGGLAVAGSRVEGVRFLRVDLVRDDLGSLQGRFGLTVSSEVLEHVGRANRKRFAMALAGTLAAGGYLVLTTPNRDRAQDIADLGALYQPEEDLLSVEETLELIREAGLTVHDTRSATFFERLWERSVFFRRVRSRLPRSREGPDLLDRLFARSQKGLYFVVCAQRI